MSASQDVRTQPTTSDFRPLTSADGEDGADRNAGHRLYLQEINATPLARRPPDSVASHARAAATSNYRRDIIPIAARALIRRAAY